MSRHNSGTENRHMSHVHGRYDIYTNLLHFCTYVPTFAFIRAYVLKYLQFIMPHVADKHTKGTNSSIKAIPKWTTSSKLNVQSGVFKHNAIGIAQTTRKRKLCGVTRRRLAYVRSCSEPPVGNGSRSEGKRQRQPHIALAAKNEHRGVGQMAVGGMEALDQCPPPQTFKAQG